MSEKIDFGKYSIATSWNELTLQQWCNYLRKADSSNDGNVTLIDTLEAFSDIPRKIIMQLPTDLFEAIVGQLKWVIEEPNIEPMNKITINGEDYIINHLEKLKVKEYYDITTLMENDKFNYPALFAILCRKQNEVYDEDFLADKFEERIEMFENICAIDGMKLIAFFLNLLLIYNQHLTSYSMVNQIRQEITELVRNIKDSQKHTGCSILSRVRQNMILRKLKKYLNQI